MPTACNNKNGCHMTKRDGIQQRKNGDGTLSYRAQVRMHGAPPLSKTFRRRTDAKIWIEQTKNAIRGGTLVSNEASRTTLREALERLLNEPPRDRKTGKLQKGWVRQQQRIKVWMKNPLAYRFLPQLHGIDFAKYRDEQRQQGKAENTIRIALVLISTLYKAARRDWGMVGLRNPIADVTLPAGSNKRDRRKNLSEPWLSAADEKALLLQLRKCGPYMAPLAELAIETAMRQGELLSLTFANLDLQKGIAHLVDTKNGESRDVPLSTRAVKIFRALPRPLSDDSRLFPISARSVIRVFREACNSVGVENLHFHDLRHEATMRICNLLSMHEAMRVTGHKTPAMLMRYYHPKAEDLARKLG